MSDTAQRTCPGCKVSLPIGADCDTNSYTASSECMNLYNEILGIEFGNALIFGQVHQLTVDTYAVQHAGGIHRDKSVIIHLSGLYLMMCKSYRPPVVPPHLQQMSKSMDGTYPHYDPPEDLGVITVLDVARAADSVSAYVEAVKQWATSVWRGWESRHADIALLVEQHMQLDNQ